MSHPQPDIKFQFRSPLPTTIPNPSFSTTTPPLVPFPTPLNLTIPTRPIYPQTPSTPPLPPTPYLIEPHAETTYPTKTHSISGIVMNSSCCCRFNCRNFYDDDSKEHEVIPLITANEILHAQIGVLEGENEGLKGRVRELEDDNLVLRGENEEFWGSGCWRWWGRDDGQGFENDGSGENVNGVGAVIGKEEWENTEDKIKRLELELEGWKRGYEDLRDGVKGSGVVMLRKEDFDRGFVGRLRRVDVDGWEGSSWNWKRYDVS